MSESIPPSPQNPPAAPIPAQALTYSNFAGPHRPGIIIAIGVIAMVVAVASGLTNLGIGLYSMGNYFMARWGGMATAASSVSSTSSTGLGVKAVFKTGEVGIAANTLQAVGGLDGARVRELSKLMRGHGREILGIDEDTEVTDAGIRGLIRQSGTSPTADGAAFFVTDEGRIDVYSDRAEFTSTDGSRTIKTSVLKNFESMTAGTQTNIHVTNIQTSATTGPATTQAADTTLTASQVQKVMNAIKKFATAPLNPAQTATVQSQISAQNQQLVTPGSTTPVTSVTAFGNNVTVQFDGGQLAVGPKGEVTSMMSFSAFSGAAAAGFTAKLNTTPIVLSIFESLASGALAIYLLVAVGILVFRSSFNSPRLLRIYAWIKIPLALVGGLAFCWMNYDRAAAMSAAIAKSMSLPPTPVSLVEHIVWGCGLAIIGIAFPIGLLIALRGKTLRDYFNQEVQAELERNR